MVSLSITPESLLVAKVTTYTVSLGTPIPITADDSIIVTLSSEMKVDTESFSCFVRVRNQAATTKASCSYAASSQRIIVTNYLSSRLRSLLGTNSANSQTTHPLYPRTLSASIDTGSVVDVLLTGIKNKETNGAYSSSTAASLINVSLGNYNSISDTYSLVASSDF